MLRRLDPDSIVLSLRLFPTFQHSNSVSFEGPNVPVRLRTYPQIGQLDDDQNVEQAKADGRNHLSSFFIGPQGQKIILPGTLVGWHRAGFTQKRHRKEATVGENSYGDRLSASPHESRQIEFSGTTADSEKNNNQQFC
jgi:hypothetical protein